MNNVDLLIKCATLLFRENELAQINPGSVNSADLIRKVIDTVKLPEVELTISQEKTQLIGLKSTIVYLCDLPGNEVADRLDIIQRVRMNCTYDDKAFEAFKAGIEDELTESQLKRQILSMRRGLNDYLKELEIASLIRSANVEISFKRDSIPNMKKYLTELAQKLEPFMFDAGDQKDPSVVCEIDLGDTVGVTQIFTNLQSSESAVGMLKTGWQGLNEMMQGGFRPGEQWVCGALQHKYKTGFSLSIFKQVAIYNDPYLKDPTKKPLLIRVSFEDRLENNFRFLYENVIMNRTGQMPDIRLVPPEEIGSTVMGELSKRGYYIKMLHVNPTGWSYKDLNNLVLRYESEGYEVHFFMADYFPMLPTVGCEDGPMGHALQDMYRRNRAFFSQHGIPFFTPHQLSTDAKQMIRDGKTDFVKELPGKGYYRGSKQIDQEVDGELYIHIEAYNQRKFLTVQRGKHRGVPVIPDDQMYMVLPFPEKGPIIDDLERDRIDSKRVGGGAVGSGNEVPIDFFGA